MEMDHVTAGKVRVPGMAVKYSAAIETGQRSPNAVRPAPPPRLGEHTREVLAELGLTQAEIDALGKRGVVGTIPI